MFTLINFRTWHTPLRLDVQRSEQYSVSVHQSVLDDVPFFAQLSPSCNAEHSPYYLTLTENIVTLDTGPKFKELA